MKEDLIIQIINDLAIVRYYAGRQQASNTYREIVTTAKHISMLLKYDKESAIASLEKVIKILTECNMLEVMKHYYELTNGVR